MLAVFVISAAANAQSGGPWRASVGLGVESGHVLGREPAGVAEFGRTIFALYGVSVGAEITGAMIAGGNRVCLTSESTCDNRELLGYLAPAATAEAALPVGRPGPYVRAALGAWSGADQGAGPSGSSERGTLFGAELGARFTNVDLGLRQQRLNGARRGFVRVTALVLRRRF